MKNLVLIPARGGSKEIPNKNIKILCGKPLIHYSIEVAREVVDDKDICVSSDSSEIIRIVEECQLRVPFVRPAHFASDESEINDTILHALDFYTAMGIHYDTVILLQPTSPLRTATQIVEALSLYTQSIDMVVSVLKLKNPSLIFKENDSGYLTAAFLDKTARRQDVVNPLYKYNGSIYIMNTDSLKKKRIRDFTNIVKYVMPRKMSVDIDSAGDWELIEKLMK